MPNKRKNDSSNEIIRKKIRKLESQLKKRRNYKRLVIYSDSEHESDLENKGVDDIRYVNSFTPSESNNRDRGFQAQPPILDEVPSTSKEPESTTDLQDTAEPDLDIEILALLGDAPKTDIKFGQPTHKDLASRWQEILLKGLPKEVKDKLMEEYLVPKNCDMLVPPSLNPEVKVALAENMIKRDAALLAKQNQMSVAIAAINKSIELIIAKESYTKILKPISDACRLLCDSHFTDSRTRRGFVISSINPEMKETLNETKRDTLLFGENIGDKLKSAKSIKRSAADLKQIRNEKSNVFNKNNFTKPNQNSRSRLNWRTMPRKITPNRTEAPRTRQSQRQSTLNVSQQRGQREAAERAPAANTNRRR